MGSCVTVSNSNCYFSLQPQARFSLLPKPIRFLTDTWTRLTSLSWIVMLSTSGTSFSLLSVRLIINLFQNLYSCHTWFMKLSPNAPILIPMNCYRNDSYILIGMWTIWLCFYQGFYLNCKEVSVFLSVIAHILNAELPATIILYGF